MSGLPFLAMALHSLPSLEPSPPFHLNDDGDDGDDDSDDGDDDSDDGDDDSDDGDDDSDDGDDDSDDGDGDSDDDHNNGFLSVAIIITIIIITIITIREDRGKGLGDFRGQRQSA
eukprot:2279889-Pleurochrysis_carterae.AAC.3